MASNNQFCIRCGHRLAAGARFCGQCGAQQPASTPRHPERPNVNVKQPRSAAAQSEKHIRPKSPTRLTKGCLVLLGIVVCLGGGLVTATFLWAGKSAILETLGVSDELMPQVDSGAQPQIELLTGSPVFNTVLPAGGAVEPLPNLQINFADSAILAPSDLKVAVVLNSPAIADQYDLPAAGDSYEISFADDVVINGVAELALPLFDKGDIPDSNFTVLRLSGTTWTDMGGIVDGNVIRVATDRFSVFRPSYYPKNSSLPPYATIGFVNKGTVNATVRPATYAPLQGNMPNNLIDAAVGTSWQGSPGGLWPNPARYLSLPLGVYTMCVHYPILDPFGNHVDRDGNGIVDYAHYFVGPYRLDEAFRSRGESGLAFVDQDIQPPNPNAIPGRCDGPPGYPPRGFPSPTPRPTYTPTATPTRYLTPDQPGITATPNQPGVPSTPDQPDPQQTPDIPQDSVPPDDGTPEAPDDPTPQPPSEPEDDPTPTVETVPTVATPRPTSTPLPPIVAATNTPTPRPTNTPTPTEPSCEDGWITQCETGTPPPCKDGWLTNCSTLTPTATRQPPTTTPVPTATPRPPTPTPRPQPTATPTTARSAFSIDANFAEQVSNGAVPSFASQAQLNINLSTGAVNGTLSGSYSGNGTIFCNNQQVSVPVSTSYRTQLSGSVNANGAFSAPIALSGSVSVNGGDCSGQSFGYSGNGTLSGTLNSTTGAATLSTQWSTGGSTVAGGWSGTAR